MPLSTPQISELNDEALFALIEKGDERAFTQVYDRYHKLLYVLAYRYLMNANMAEDVVQHVFSRLWEFRTELRVGISLKNYLFTMTKNHVLNLIRNENSAIAKNYEMAQSAPAYEDNLIEDLEKKELMSNFYKAVDMLPVPGAQGITELVYRSAFAQIFIGGTLPVSMIVSRAASFYVPMAVGLATVLWRMARKAGKSEWKQVA